MKQDNQQESQSLWPSQNKKATTKTGYVPACVADRSSPGALSLNRFGEIYIGDLGRWLLFSNSLVRH